MYDRFKQLSKKDSYQNLLSTFLSSRQLSGFTLHIFIILCNRGRLVSQKHIFELAFPYPPNSLASESLQNKISSSLVLPGPHHLDHLHLLYGPCKSSPTPAISLIVLQVSHLFPSFCSFLYVYAFPFTATGQNPPRLLVPTQMPTSLSNLSLKLSQQLIYLSTIVYLHMFHFLHYLFLFLGVFCTGICL